MGLSSFFSSLIGKKSVDNSALEAEIKSLKEHLAEAESQCKALENQLKESVNGDIDPAVLSQLADVEKFKKQLKELEDELEESEDTAKSWKRKSEQKDQDILDLQDSLGKEKKEAKALKEDLYSVQRDLELKIEELNLKIGALDFIQEILSAKDTSSEDSNKLNSHIDIFESFVKGTFTDVNSYIYNTYSFSWQGVSGKAGLEAKKKFFWESCDQWAAAKRKSWLDGKTTVAFVGEFSAGKTSIVNRILSQDDPSVPKLPVSMKATTAIPTYIAGGSAVSYSFISGDGKKKTILEETFKRVSKEVLDQIKGVSSLIKYFVMEYNNPNLSGLSILDTPGFNSNDKEDKQRTIDVINECDALFWVFDVNAGTINRSSIVNIKENLRKPLYVVINKVDTKAPSEVDKVEELIKKTLADEGLNVEKYIRFSSEAPLESIMEPVQTVKKDDARQSYVRNVGADIEEIMSFLENKVKEINNAYNRAFKQGDQITNSFNNCLQEMFNDCETAKYIPQFKEGFKVFGIGSDDKFQMSIQQGHRLKSILDKIASDNIQALADSFNKRVNKAAEIQQKWSDLNDFKSSFQKVKDSYEQYKKISKPLI